MNCLPLHLSIGPCIDPGCVDVGMPKELREEDKRHPGTIQMHGTGMPKLVWMPDTPGLAVWKSGHIGVYIGNGEVIEAMDTRYGVVKTKLQGRGWIHWLEVPGIKYD